MGKFEVTQAQWRAVAGWRMVQRPLAPNPSHFQGDYRPVEGVSWDDATEFCVRLARRTGRAYRLPTEAEWEYACRAKTETDFAFGEAINPEIVNYDGSKPPGSGDKGKTRGETVPVGSLGVANAFGLFDMAGNVLEWCQDKYTDYGPAPLTNPVGHQPSWYRILRGGSWLGDAYSCRSATRNINAPSSRFYNVGFRVVVGPRIR